MNGMRVLSRRTISAERTGTLRQRKRPFAGLCKRQKSQAGNWVVPRSLFVPCVEIHMGFFAHKQSRKAYKADIMLA